MSYTPRPSNPGAPAPALPQAAVGGRPISDMVRRTSHYRCQCGDSKAGNCQCSINCSCGCRWGRPCNCAQTGGCSKGQQSPAGPNNHQVAADALACGSCAPGARPQGYPAHPSHNAHPQWQQPPPQTRSSVLAQQQPAPPPPLQNSNVARPGVVTPEQPAVFLEGTLVNLLNFALDRRNSGQDHYLPSQAFDEAPKVTNGARTFANAGVPVGLLAADGSRRTFVLLVPAPQVANYLARPTKVCGRLAGLDIGGGLCVIVDRIEVYDEAARSWIDVAIQTPR